MDKCLYVAIKGALDKSDGNLSHASKMLNRSLPTIRKHAKKLGLWPYKASLVLFILLAGCSSNQPTELKPEDYFTIGFKLGYGTGLEGTDKTNAFAILSSLRTNNLHGFVAHFAESDSPYTNQISK